MTAIKHPAWCDPALCEDQTDEHGPAAYHERKLGGFIDSTGTTAFTATLGQHWADESGSSLPSVMLEERLVVSAEETESHGLLLQSPEECDRLIDLIGRARAALSAGGAR